RVEARIAEKNRRRTVSESVSSSIDDHIAWLGDQIERLDHAIEAATTASTTLAEPLRRLQGPPSVSRVVKLTVLTRLPELGTLHRKQITALAGFAPFDCESGLLRGWLTIWGGRRAARAMLLVGAWCAARRSRALRAFYDRLVGRGKSE